MFDSKVFNLPATEGSKIPSLDFIKSEHSLKNIYLWKKKKQNPKYKTKTIRFFFSFNSLPMYLENGKIPRRLELR